MTSPTTAALVALALCCTACSQPGTGRATNNRAEHTIAGTEQQQTSGASCCSTHEAADTALSDASVYLLGSSWTDMHGDTVALADLRGRARVVAMIFTNCAYVCPRITTDMRAIEARLDASLRNRVGFVLFSIDPERDTPKALAAYAETMKLDPAHWMLLRGDDADVRELAAVLGVKYKKESNGDFSHSILITVLNSHGEIVYRQEGLGQDPRRTVEELQTLLAAQ